MTAALAILVARFYGVDMGTVRASLEPAIRRATTADAADIARLSQQLGYPTTPEQSARRLLEVNRNPEHAVFVAADGEAVIGWVHALIGHSLVADTTAEVAGLVVDEAYRGQRVGRVLLQQVERWAQEQSCIAVRLRSNVVLSRAHAFYQNLGYELTKTSKNFYKRLA